MTRDILVDPKAYDLAALWLSEHNDTTTVHDSRVMSLAQAIQGAIEDWCEDEARADEENAARDEEQRALRGLSEAERERI